MAQTVIQQGDFINTSDGLANSQRILQSNLEDVKTTLGEALLPVAVEFAGWLKTVMPDVIDFAREMGEKLGPAVETVGDFIKDKLLPFVERVWPHIRDFALWTKDLVVQFVDFLREEIGPRFLTLIQNLEQPATDAWTALKEMGTAINELADSFQRVNPEGSKFLDFLFWLQETGWEIGVLDAFRTFGNIVEFLADQLNRVVKAWERLKSLGTFGGAFGGAGGDFDGYVPPGTIPGGSTNRLVPPSGTTSRSGPNVQVTINGPIDAESTAREIRRILDDSSRRTGFQPVLV
jgi:hypothetical protein